MTFFLVNNFKFDVMNILSISNAFEHIFSLSCVSGMMQSMFLSRSILPNFDRFLSTMKPLVYHIDARRLSLVIIWLLFVWPFLPYELPYAAFPLLCWLWFESPPLFSSNLLNLLYLPACLLLSTTTLSSFISRVRCSSFS